ncbi:MAG TPA: hypothetical protein DCX54_11975, partial [Flavobacteriales bacterium]|nr:hypothetical protein [Flavobacteriales bacterium]
MRNFTMFKITLTIALLSLFTLSESQTNIAPNAIAAHSGGGATIYGPQNYNDLINIGGSTTPWGWVSSNGWIEYTWPSPITTNEVVLYPADRPLTSGTLEYWNGSGYTFIMNTGSGVNTVPLSLTFPPVTTTKIRINNVAGSNPNHTEILVYQAILAANNATVLSVDSPAAFCEGTRNIMATIANHGTNIITSVLVNWTLNGTPQIPVAYTDTLDTLQGSGPNSALVFLGSNLFGSGVTDEIVVWTSLPNGVADGYPGDDTVTALVQPSLSGNFTIDPLGSGGFNYLTISDAIDDLNSFGVCGPVHFDVAAGTYSEQMTLGEINGASASNTITFAADSAGVIVEYGPSSTADNWVLNLNKTQWVTIDGFTFQHSSGGSSSYRALCLMDGGS